MNLKPFTKEEQAFAEENHDLVYAFLNEKKLSETDFYDIVIFGYLRAVQEYCRTGGLSKYRFSTLAWKRMHHILMDYYKYLESPNIVKMKARGDRMHDIAKAERMTFQDINRVLSDIYPLVRKILYGGTI